MRTRPPGWGHGDPLLAMSAGDQTAGDGSADADRQDDAPPVGERSEREVTRSPSRAPEAVMRALTGFPVELDRLVDGKPDDRLTQPAQDGGWGMVEILSHLRDWEEVFDERLVVILEQDRPRLATYDDSLWAIERNYREENPRRVLARFRELREALVVRVEALDESDWQRVGLHPRRGEVTVHWLLDRIADHDAEHLEQARDVLG